MIPQRPCPTTTTTAALARAEALLATEVRHVIGIVGPPGAGKSTLATWLEQTLNTRNDTKASLVAQIPMDGFHLPNRVLAERGLTHRKGAPDTFDVDAYLHLLRRIRAAKDDETLRAPAFSRDLDEPVPDAHIIAPSVRLIISEGNYLLLDQDPWNQARRLFSETWFVTAGQSVCQQRLIRRHMDGGRTPDAARRWALEVDLPNADLINATAVNADIRIAIS